MPLKFLVVDFLRSSSCCFITINDLSRLAAMRLLFAPFKLNMGSTIGCHNRIR